MWKARGTAQHALCLASYRHCAQGGLSAGFSLNIFLSESLRLLWPKVEGSRGNSESPKVSIVSNSRKSLKNFRVSCKKQKHHYNRLQPEVPLLEFISGMLFLVKIKIHFFMLNNVPPCNFQGLILDVLLCIWNCRLKAFSKLEVTDTQNCDP